MPTKIHQEPIQETSSISFLIATLFWAPLSTQKNDFDSSTDKLL